ncbi:MAG: toll/interleukin-1 receptor domain-containing protein [Thiolinea sp.]
MQLPHSRKNQAVANDIANQLRLLKHDVWIDTSSIVAGQQWDESIAEGIKAQAAFITLLSPDSVKSTEVKNELNMALSERKTIIPVFVAKVILDNEWQYKLSRLQLLNYEVDPEKCIADIHHALTLLDEVLFLPGDEVTDTLMNEQIRIFTFWIRRLIHSGGNSEHWVRFTGTVSNNKPQIILQRNQGGSLTFRTSSGLTRDSGMSAAQKQQLAMLQWQPDADGYVQVIDIDDEASLNKAANLILITFILAYGVDPDESIQVSHAL